MQCQKIISGGTSRRTFLSGGLTSAATAAAVPHSLWAAPADDLHLIALEEHIATPEQLDLPRQEGIAFALRFNSWLADEVIAAHPARFRAFAKLPLQTPEAAADQLERAVRDDGCLGCMAYGSINGKFLNDPAFEPVLARAEQLDIPIDIHAAWPTPAIREQYYGCLDDAWPEKVLSGPEPTLLSRHLDWCRTSKAFQHLTNGFDPSRIRGTMQLAAEFLWGHINIYGGSCCPVRGYTPRSAC